MSDEESLLSELSQGGQDSWDWGADLRFARHLNDTDAIEVLEGIVKSKAPMGIILAVHHVCAGHIKRRRLRALRVLVREGQAKSGWLGVGEGGRCLFGVNRVRTYALAQTPEK